MNKTCVLAAILPAVLCISGNLLAACLSTDFTGDCRVYLADFAVLAEQWIDDGSEEFPICSIGRKIR